MVRGGVGGGGEGRPCQQIFVKRPLKGLLPGKNDFRALGTRKLGRGGKQPQISIKSDQA